MSHTQNTTPNRPSVFPKTTDRTIIFPFKDSRFERDYHPANTDERVTVEQVNEVLTFTEKTLKEYLSCSDCLGYVWAFFLIITLFYYSYIKQFEFLTLSFAEFAYLLLLAIVGYLLWLFRQKKTEQARIVIEQTLYLHNQKLANVGVRWSLPKDFPSWIELHNDFRSQAVPQNNPSLASYDSNSNYHPPQRHNQVQV